jgi:hypothetical protein
MQAARLDFLELPIVNCRLKPATLVSVGNRKLAIGNEQAGR